MNSDRWWVRNAPTLAGPVMLVGTILFFVAVAALADAPVFVALAVVGIAVVLFLRGRARRQR